MCGAVHALSLKCEYKYVIETLLLVGMFSSERVVW